MANRDPDVTDLASMDQPELAMEALGLALERHGEEATLGAIPTLAAMATLTGGDQPPLPPTLVMDDPSDPPPSIDSDYSDARGMARQPPPPPPPPSASAQSAPHDSVVRAPVDGNAPPPYLVPDGHHDGTRPPPYIEY